MTSPPLSPPSKGPPSRDEEQPFWRVKTLAQMTDAEWESLCDGCGQCCLVKLEHSETGEVVPTDLTCRLLNVHTCRCSDYSRRHRKVPGCLQLTPELVPALDWLPDTCGYRRVAAGQDLPDWHPLRCGDPEEVHRLGISVRGKVTSEADVADLEQLLAERYGFEEA